MKLPHLDWVNQDSPYLRQHKDGFRLLRFYADMERAFDRYHTDVYLIRIRWALLVAVFLMGMFALLDALTMPSEVRNPVVLLRLGLIVPMLLLTWWSTYHERLVKHLQLIGGFCALAAGLGVVAIVGTARAHDFPLPYEGLILVIVFFYFLAGLRFVAASVCGWLTFLAYLSMELLMGMPAETLIFNCFFLATANVIGSVGCYFLEYASRENFLAQGLLQDLAEKDGLTGLLNRRAFNEYTERSWRQASREQVPVAVMMIDVDFFKRYNDHFGHSAGDEALKKVAGVLAEHAKRPLDVVARYGGEEFIGLWFNVSEMAIREIAEDLRRGVEQLHMAHPQSDAAQVVTISIGIAYLTPRPHIPNEEAQRLADVALYLAKENGRNQAVLKRHGY
ncbi:diguanylate cyclase (GGDEF) domain-containing protein [Atopomonas hussainii]|uniref:diguanylate cyclase n=1 Tax=Atopomonas hussainii TaxID=1429083 RepID=A0A1H7LGK3_9GAMM|nr:diguanylate cyclase [Atopomonas hussainii]SEK97990.1 diguanylate cyclase (GGDEF) domain-containing protein [Atopomonas hussainii]